MPKKIITIVMIALALTASVVIPLGTGCSLISGQSTTESDLDLTLLEEVWEIIQEEYVETDELDTETLIRGAVKGMVDALDDPHSAYMDPDDYERFTSDLSGEFEGIGAHVEERDGQIIVIAPIPGTPADEAGIKPGDVIVGVDGESIVGWSIQDAVSAIRGPRGTPVTLLILREGDSELLEIEIIRAEIEVPSIYFEMLGDIAHIKIAQFTERTSEELSTALNEVASQEATGIIIDLRNNPGGLLSTVVDVASRFLNEGIVISVVDNEGNKTDYPVEDADQIIELPVVVLVNEFSASGSEVLAGALQDYDRAVVAGNTTFGKGSVNILYELSDDSGIYITVARWYTPGGHLIEGEGIEPDFELDLEEIDPVEWALDYLESHM
ncbi:MAG TPA: S41 family peptidase [Dehalococcoidia bacterium]|nr:S41 family peptidase [Dehalococcoidia bacterium]